MNVGSPVTMGNMSQETLLRFAPKIERLIDREPPHIRELSEFGEQNVSEAGSHLINSAEAVSGVEGRITGVAAGVLSGAQELKENPQMAQQNKFNLLLDTLNVISDKSSQLPARGGVIDVKG